MVYDPFVTSLDIQKFERQQERMRANDAHVGCFTIKEAAAILNLHRESARELLANRGVLHRAPNASGRTAPWHVTAADLKATYPALKRRHRAVTTDALSQEEALELLGGETIRPDTDEFEAAKLRNHRRYSE